MIGGGSRQPGPTGPCVRPGVPEHMDDASTRSSMLRGERTDRRDASWLYYHQPVQNYLRGLGCPAQDIDDLCHEILIKLQTSIVLNYDSSRPFRPYFKAAIRNLYFSHLRAHPRADAKPVEDLAAARADDADDPPESFPYSLAEYARQVYDLFAGEAAPHLATGIAMLHAWVIDGVKQGELAAAANLTDRQVRNLLCQAADALAQWMQDKLHREDLDELAGLARRKGIILDLGSGGYRDLFSHMSRRKRTRALMILAIIYRQTMPPPAQ